MPINDFNDDCFVAFTDISGFKAMMKSKDEAAKAMNRFYSSGYDSIKQSNQTINGIFISDCGIIFSTSGTKEEQLSNLLKVIQKINSQLIDHNIMLTTSICWGRFSYKNKIVFNGIEKQPVYGNAYLSAFLDNEMGTPKLEPGFCRVLKSGVEDLNISSLDQFSSIKETNKYYLYYWMCSTQDTIKTFETEYKNAYNMKYSGMLSAIKNSNKTDK